MSRGPAGWKSSDVAWRGGKRPYDLLRELLVSGLVVAVLVVGLAFLFASPDPRPATFEEWSHQGTRDFVVTTLEEIEGTSLTATYGPPYQTTAQNGSTQGFGVLSPEQWFGRALPIDTWQDFVVQPLESLGQQPVDDAIAAWDAADAQQRKAWTSAYKEALRKGTYADGTLAVATGEYGPLDTLVQAQLGMARTGALDAALLYSNAESRAGGPAWYSNDQTRALMYFGDSGQGGDGPDCISPGQAPPADGACWYYNLSVDNAAPRYGGFLAGGTWGIVNEVANWPGAWWLVPYSFWYQWGYGADGASADLYAMIATAVVSIPFMLLPWIPGLRDIPKGLRVYRIMWGDYYRLVRREQARGTGRSRG